MDRFYGVERDPNGALRRPTLLDAKVVTRQVNDDGEMIYTVAVPSGITDSGDAFSIGFCRDDHPETYMERYYGWMQGGARADRDRHWYAKGGLELRQAMESE